MAKLYRTTGTLQRARVMHPPGTELPIEDAEVARLVALGAIVPVVEARGVAPSTFDASASVKVLVPQIRASVDAVLLAALRQTELNRPDGPRASVVTAIDERLDVIAAHENADGADEDDGE